MLAQDALFECAKLLENEPDADIIYSDEDKIDSAGNKHFQPYFKPDFNIDLLRANNYICHLFIVRMSIVKQVGFLNPDLDGAQDYDYILRCVEKTDSIYHIPKMLYHWRCHENSTSENPDSKLYAFKAHDFISVIDNPNIISLYIFYNFFYLFFCFYKQVILINILGTALN